MKQGNQRQGTQLAFLAAATAALAAVALIPIAHAIEIVPAIQGLASSI
ncbi:MAG: hypothetical protein AAGH45_05430 [Pseudomonadota bacterium]